MNSDETNENAGKSSVGEAVSPKPTVNLIQPDEETALSNEVTEFTPNDTIVETPKHSSETPNDGDDVKHMIKEIHGVAMKISGIVDDAKPFFDHMKSEFENGGGIMSLFKMFMG